MVDMIAGVLVCQRSFGDVREEMKLNVSSGLVVCLLKRGSLNS